MEGKTEGYGGLWDREADVVIAGAGGAGLAAAIEAAAARADTMVFEKQPTTDDASSSLCGGAISFAGTDLQEKEGIKDSNDLLYKDLMDVGQWKNDEKLVETYLNNQLDTYYWLTGLGVRFHNIAAIAGVSVPRNHHTDPPELVRILKETAEKKGAKVLFDARVTGLVTDEGKRVMGVSVEGKGWSLLVKARKGVVLTTGGFGRDPERLESLIPGIGKANVVLQMGPGHTGDGHRMAEKVGAYMRDLENVKPTFGMHAAGTLVENVSFMYYNGAIIVNKNGERFVDESVSYKDVGKAALGQPDGIGFEIFDHKLYEAAVEKAKGLFPEKELLGLDKERIKLLVRGNTIEELASQIGVSPEALRETVDRYNSYVSGGKDLDFGRAALTWGYGKIVKIDTPPFYAFEARGGMVGTYAGIAVDEDMHVLGADGRIPGLYAAGELIGGFHGASYMTGTSVGKALIFGRIAGRNAAAGG